MGASWRRREIPSDWGPTLLLQGKWGHFYRPGTGDLNTRLLHFLHWILPCLVFFLQEPTSFWFWEVLVLGIPKQQWPCLEATSCWWRDHRCVDGDSKGKQSERREESLSIFKVQSSPKVIIEVINIFNYHKETWPVSFMFCLRNERTETLGISRIILKSTCNNIRQWFVRIN